jgi:hypothetical protein
MPFPNLALRAGGTYHAEATGVPDNGNNTFTIPFVAAGIDPDLVDEDWLDINVIPSGAGVTGATLGAPLLSVDKGSMTLSFAADGITAARVIVKLNHTGVR